MKCWKCGRFMRIVGRKTVLGWLIMIEWYCRKCGIYEVEDLR